jgi:hypothetical protein
MNNVQKAVILVFVLLTDTCIPKAIPEETFTIARLKYGGGGDWYSNPSSLPNLMRFICENAHIKTFDQQAIVSLAGEELFAYPIVYMNGHGNVFFTSKEAMVFRQYLTNGGFLFADDNYGFDKSFRREMKKVFPDKEFILLPKNHEIFTILFPFPDGLPKIHEHDGKPAQAYAIFHEGKMVVFYSFQSDLGDGWEDPSVHNDPETLRDAALKMGTNVIVWALTH